MGVGGQILDKNGQPLVGLTVHVEGLLGSSKIDQNDQTGQAKKYGEGGYEINLAITPMESVQKLWIQVQDKDGKSLSERYYFDTYRDCSRNLILINFRDTR